MKKIKVMHLGLLCGALFFVAGMVFTSDAPKIWLLVIGAFLLLYPPIYEYYQKESLKPQRQPSVKEYGAILVFVAILVAVVYFFAQGAIESAVSSSLSGPSF